MIGTVPAGMILQHVLVFFLMVVSPLWERHQIGRLKRSTEPGKKVRLYGKVVTVSWMCALVAALTVGPKMVVTLQAMPGELTWLSGGSRGGMFLRGLTAGILLVILWPAVLAIWKEDIRTKAVKSVKKLAFLLPSTREERQWWWLVCFTAGVCEEIAYRGFLLHYLHVAPFHLTLMWALVASSVIFGIGHIYQGVAGAVQTALIGCVMGGMFLATGNLLLPIVVHILLDLRVLALLPEGFETAAE
jgi:membrane protease YdiL (CAAX protease family)